MWRGVDFFFFFLAQEVKSLLEELSFQKGELNVQISEKKTQLALIKQEIEKEEENLQVVLGQMSKHKTGKFKGKQSYKVRVWKSVFSRSQEKYE